MHLLTLLVLNGALLGTFYCQISIPYVEYCTPGASSKEAHLKLTYLQHMNEIFIARNRQIQNIIRIKQERGHPILYGENPRSSGALIATNRGKDRAATKNFTVTLRGSRVVLVFYHIPTSDTFAEQYFRNSVQIAISKSAVFRTKDPRKFKELDDRIQYLARSYLMECPEAILMIFNANVNANGASKQSNNPGDTLFLDTKDPEPLKR